MSKKKCEICNDSFVSLEEFKVGDTIHIMCYQCIKKNYNEMFPKRRIIKQLFCKHDKRVIYDYCRGDIPGTKHIAWLCKDCGKITFSYNI